jgi:hypothetical protein
MLRFPEIPENPEIPDYLENPENLGEIRYYDYG